MLLDDLLNLSLSGRDYLEKMKGKSVPFKMKAGEFLRLLERNQCKILEGNFKNLGSLDQVLDKLGEIMVAIEFFDDDPVFFPDTEGKPDIWLKKDDKYVEVKRLNNSNYQKQILSRLVNNGEDCIDTSECLCKQKEIYDGLFKKVQDHIDKAVKQLARTKKPGIVYFLYSLDIFGYREYLERRKVEFEGHVEAYFAKKCLNDVELRISHENKVFFA